MRPQDFEIVGQKILRQNGSLTTVRYWLKGHVHLKGGKWITGITGKETVVTVQELRPVKVFYVGGK